MQIHIGKPDWKNKEWSFNLLPHISILVISHYAYSCNIGWLFWSVSISNDF